MSIPLTTWPSNLQQPDVPANDNNQTLGVLVQLAVEDVANDAPTTTGADIGKAWIVGTGTWPGAPGQHAVALSVGATLWRYYTPQEGWFAWNLATPGRIEFDGTGWVAVAGGGGGGSTAGRHATPIMAGSMQPSATGGCAALATIASAGNQPDIVSLDFDAATEEYAQFAIPMPKSWNEGTITAAFRWSHAATTTNFGVVWGIQAVAVSDDDPIAVAYGTAQTVTDTGGTTNDLYISPETSAITVAGTPAAEDTVYFRLYRKAADGADTLAVDARLHSVVLYITTDADTDA